MVGIAVDKLHIPPSEFWQWEESDRMFAMAYYRVVNAIESYEKHIYDQEERRKRPPQSRNKTGK